MDMEAEYNVRISGDTVFATKRGDNQTVRFLSGGHYINLSKPYRCYGGVLEPISGDQPTRYVSKEIISSLEDYPAHPDATFVLLDGCYYEVMTCNKGGAEYRSYGEVHAALQDAASRLKHIYSSIAARGGCGVFLTLNADRTSFIGMSLGEAHALIVEKLKAFRKGMQYKAGSWRPICEAYFIERYFTPEPVFHVHGYLLFHEPKSAELLKERALRHWHMGSVCAKPITDEAVCDYPVATIPKERLHLKKQLLSLQRRQLPQEDACRILSALLKEYRKDPRAKKIIKKTFSEMYYPAGKRMSYLYGDCVKKPPPITCLESELGEYMIPETMEFGTRPIRNDRTGRCVGESIVVTGRVQPTHRLLTKEHAGQASEEESELAMSIIKDGRTEKKLLNRAIKTTPE